MAQLRQALDVELAERGQRPRHFNDYYPPTGPVRRELYGPHMAFFAAGATYRERLMLAANRVGKTEGVGLYELVAHMTGRYPAWWVGRRFNRPVRAWAAGDTGKTVREILQYKLLGPAGRHGSGVLPYDTLLEAKKGSGVADSVELVYVRHCTGGSSQLIFKSYDQRRVAFQGTEQDVILLDEEPPLDIYTECLLRTMTNNGVILCTFTPLQGLSETVLAFLEDGNLNSPVAGKFVCSATWDDVPHLSDDVKEALWQSIPPYQRDARSRGVPQLGSGAIYPIPESDFIVAPFEIPPHYKRVYGMDVGWNMTAAVWGAYDPDTHITYLTSEHYRGQAEPIIHAEAIKSRGGWIPGTIDPAARGRSQDDGSQLLQKYLDLGLELTNADNGVESGIYTVWEKLSTGKMKVFNNLSNWLAEYRIYRRDEKGRVVKKKDHLMDATRYLAATGPGIMRALPIKKAPSGGGAPSWMG